jgi:hypothetical protein
MNEELSLCMCTNTLTDSRKKKLIRRLFIDQSSTHVDQTPNIGSTPLPVTRTKVNTEARNTRSEKTSRRRSHSMFPDIKRQLASSTTGRKKRPTGSKSKELYGYLQAVYLSNGKRASETV